MMTCFAITLLFVVRDVLFVFLNEGEKKKID